MRNRRSRIAAMAAASLVAGLAAASAPGATPRIVAYVRDGTAVETIHPEKLTHINFAFARIDAQGEIALPHPGVARQLELLRGLKARNPRLAIFVTFNTDRPFVAPTALVTEQRERIAAAAQGVRPDLSPAYLARILRLPARARIG